jgi:hypothetical protein
MVSEEAAEDDLPGEKEAEEEEVEEEEEEEEDQGPAKLDARFLRSTYVQNLVDEDGAEEEFLGWALSKKGELEVGADPMASRTGPTKHTRNATVVGSVVIRHKDREVRKQMDAPKLLELQRGHKLVTTTGCNIAFTYGLLTYKIKEATKVHPQTLVQHDSSVFGPKIFSHVLNKF